MAARGKVLLVDDDVAILTALSRVLRRDHDITTATSATEALAKLAGGERYDAIVLDVVMPGMTGIELYERLQIDHPDQAEAVIFLTAGGFTAENDRFLRAMGSRCLDKPADIDALRRFIDRCVAKKPAT